MARIKVSRRQPKPCEPKKVIEEPKVVEEPKVEVKPKKVGKK